MFLEVRILKELVNWQPKQDEQIKSKSPTCKTDVWGTPYHNPHSVIQAVTAGNRRSETVKISPLQRSLGQEALGGLREKGWNR